MGAKEEIEARGQATGLSSLTLPKIPYIPPPVNPREMPAWYERWYKATNEWVEKVNTAIVQRSS